jgi:hypothetical protein
MISLPSILDRLSARVAIKGLISEKGHRTDRNPFDNAGD